MRARDPRRGPAPPRSRDFDPPCPVNPAACASADAFGRFWVIVSLAISSISPHTGDSKAVTFFAIGSQVSVPFAPHLPKERAPLRVWAKCDASGGVETISL